MVSSWVSFGVSGGQDFLEAAESLKTIERDFPGWVHRTISDEAGKLRDQAASVLTQEPTHGLKHTGLRATIAAGVKVVPYSDDTGTGVKIITTVPRPNMASIPAGLDSGMITGWRHPVFGRRRNRWVTEHGSLPWFTGTMATAEPTITKKISADMERAAEQIHG